MEEKIKIYSVKEVAALLHTSPNTIYKLVENNIIKSIKLDAIKILHSSLMEFLDKYSGMNLSDVDNIVPLYIDKDNKEKVDKQE